MAKHTNDAVCPLCEEKLRDADSVIADWFRNQVKPKWPTAHISWAYRGEAEQNKAYELGYSKAKYPNSLHNLNPSRALDLFELDEGKAKFNPLFFAAINEMNEKLKIKIRWGGKFKKLADYSHFELA